VFPKLTSEPISSSLINTVSAPAPAPASFIPNPATATMTITITHRNNTSFAIVIEYQEIPNIARDQ
jgi:hypothetical protein